MIHANNKAIQRVADDILKVISDKSRIDLDLMQQQLLEGTIKLHWGNRIKKVLKVLTPVGVRETIPSKFIGNVLEQWKLWTISQNLLPEDFQAFKTLQMSTDQLMPGNEEFSRHLTAHHQMSQQVVLNISFR